MTESLKETEQPSVSLDQLVASLQSFPGGTVCWRLPNGQAIAPHYHLTEVARVQKDFIDWLALEVFCLRLFNSSFPMAAGDY